MTSKKKQQKKQSTTNKTVWIVSIGLAIVLCGIGLWWFIFKYNVYSPDKEAVKADAQKVLDVVNLKGEEVYSSFNDDGCDSNTVGLQTSINCSFEGYKYYKTTGSLTNDLKEADSEIVKSGWNRTFASQDTAALSEVLSDKATQVVTYRNSIREKGMVASLGYYKDTSALSDTKLKKLIVDGKIAPPREGEYIYGVAVGASYWGCTNDSFLKICPFPPSKAK